jgi:hypothetical protein
MTPSNPASRSKSPEIPLLRLRRPTRRRRRFALRLWCGYRRWIGRELIRWTIRPQCRQSHRLGRHAYLRSKRHPIWNDQLNNRSVRIDVIRHNQFDHGRMRIHVLCGPGREPASHDFARRRPARSIRRRRCAHVGDHCASDFVGHTELARVQGRVRIHSSHAGPAPHREARAITTPFEIVIPVLSTTGQKTYPSNHRQPSFHSPNVPAWPVSSME